MKIKLNGFAVTVLVVCAIVVFGIYQIGNTLNPDSDFQNYKSAKEFQILKCQKLLNYMNQSPNGKRVN